MERVAYIQAGEDGLPYSVNGAVAARGFEVFGYAVRFFRPAELPGLSLGPGAVVVGGMGTVRAALEQVGVRPPSHASAPAALLPFLGRESWRTTPQEVRDAGRFPVFVKPYEQAKAFTGQVISDAAGLDLLLQPRGDFPSVEEDFPLLAQEPVVFLSEWRVFVVRGVAVGVSHYQGDALLFPAADRPAPAGYSMDFGVTDDGRTLLIETNDGYSLGHGGLLSTLYAELLRARWEEMTDA